MQVLTSMEEYLASRTHPRATSENKREVQVMLCKCEYSEKVLSQLGESTAIISEV